MTALIMRLVPFATVFLAALALQRELVLVVAREGFLLGSDE